MSTLGQDILTIAVEGGIGYWFQIHESKRNPYGANMFEGGEWVEVTGHQLNNDETAYDGPRHTIKASSLEKAARAIIRPDFNMNSNMKDNISRMLRERDAANIDAYEADAVVQYATFGELVYG